VLDCDILAQGVIGLIGYSYQQGISSFPEAHLKTARDNRLGYPWPRCYNEVTNLVFFLEKTHKNNSVL
jgi:hypothetical protein